MTLWLRAQQQLDLGTVGRADNNAETGALESRRRRGKAQAFRFLPGCCEITFLVLLVHGFATRFAALGLLLMTCIVELTVPDGWPIHITWAAMALAIMAWGPGWLSIDHALRRLPGLRVEEAASAWR
jgi:uncharacterized membrane protein YphA (DoxX/SURF4 family)